MSKQVSDTLLEEIAYGLMNNHAHWKSIVQHQNSLKVTGVFAEFTAKFGPSNLKK